MGRPYQILLPLFSLFLVRVDLTDLYPLYLPVKVLKVYDGDTVLVQYQRHNLRVRLSKIDAPEMGQPFFRGGDAGAFSKNCLLRFLSVGETKELEIHGMDIYRRTLGDLSGLNLKLIAEGCSGLYPHATFASEKEKYRYLMALQEAKRLKKGIWNLSGYMQPKNWRKIKKRNERRR